jgi:nitrogen fixation NifU-like protein
MDDDLRELYQEMIKDHGRRPRNKGSIEGALASAGKNPICGDNVTVFVKADGKKIDDIKFEGSGCEICIASASMMTELVKSKERGDIEKLFERFRGFLMTGSANEDLGKLQAFSGVHKFPIRVKCAVLPWHAMIAAFDGTAEVSTEKEEGQKLS